MVNTEINLFEVPQVSLSYKKNVTCSQVITGSNHAYKIFINNWDLDTLEYKESFMIVLLNTGNKVLGIYKVSEGSIGGTIVDPRVIFTAALLSAATGIILAHNHPSGGLKPSSADIRLTEKIQRGAELLDIKVLDHLIITDSNYYSFADEGQL